MLPLSCLNRILLAVICTSLEPIEVEIDLQKRRVVSHAVVCQEGKKQPGTIVDCEAVLTPEKGMSFVGHLRNRF
jgi:hypothetical protein